MTTLIRFLHLDDQPESVSWIPRQFSSWMWQSYQRELAQYPTVTETDDETSFTIQFRKRGIEYTFEYQIVTSKADLWNMLESLQHDELLGILLDQWVEPDRNAGAKAFREIRSRWPALADRTVMFTAYPMETAADLGWQFPHDQLLTKPPVQKAILEWLTGRAFSSET